MHETSAGAWCTGKTLWDLVEREVGGRLGWEIHVNPWLIHVNVWQKPLQYCKVISLLYLLIKINEKKKVGISLYSQSSGPAILCLRIQPTVDRVVLLLLLVRLSCVWFFVTSWTAAYQALVSFTISQNLFKLMSTESAMPSKHLIYCHPFFSCPQSFPA